MNTERKELERRVMEKLNLKSPVHIQVAKRDLKYKTDEQLRELLNKYGG